MDLSLASGVRPVGSGKSLCSAAVRALARLPKGRSPPRRGSFIEVRPGIEHSKAAAPAEVVVVLERAVEEHVPVRESVARVYRDDPGIASPSARAFQHRVLVLPRRAPKSGQLWAPEKRPVTRGCSGR